MKSENEKYTFDDLIEIVKKLRAPGGCPWDIEQTHESLKRNIVEEGYELVEALDSEDGAKIADESGDLLLQIVFHADIGRTDGEYDIDDVTDAVCRKLIRRHPHVFGSEKADTAEQVLENWDAIKRGERGQATIREELEGVSKYLPSLMRAEKIQKKAIKHGYMFNEIDSVCESVKNIFKLLKAGMDENTAKLYIGRLLFEMASISRSLGVEPEMALTEYTDKFIKEFEE